MDSTLICARARNRIHFLLAIQVARYLKHKQTPLWTLDIEFVSILGGVAYYLNPIIIHSLPPPHFTPHLQSISKAGLFAGDISELNVLPWPEEENQQNPRILI